MNLLILEDDQNEARLFEEIATGIFETVDSVASIQDLESRQWSKKYGVILVDLNLVDSRGIPTLSYVRDKFGKHPWVVIITGDDSIDSGSLHEHGANVILRKRDMAVARLKREFIEAKQAAAMRHVAKQDLPLIGGINLKSGDDLVAKIVKFITNWKIIAGFIASTGIIAAGHQAAYNLLGKPMVQRQIDNSLEPLIRSDSIQNERIRKNAVYGIKGYLVQKHTVPDSIIVLVEKEYSDLFGED